MTITELLAALSVTIWLYLLAFRGGFWLARERDVTTALPLSSGLEAWPPVVAIVPARDEAAFVGHAIKSLLSQDYPGPFRVILVDDQSGDGTADVARAAATALNGTSRLDIVEGTSLPRGWAGKLWALRQGIDRASRAPEYLLLTDADIVHAPDNLRLLVAKAREGRLVAVSLMARLRCDSFAERALIPAFVFFFAMLFPFAWVNRPERATAAAAGGCILVHRSTLDSVGGVTSIRSTIIDDCALAQRLKTRGAIWLGLSNRVVSLRPYGDWNAVRGMVVRSAYAQLQYSPLLLAGTLLALALTFWVPPALALACVADARFAGLAAWVAMGAVLQPTLRFYGRSPAWGIALPAIASVYLAFAVESAFRYWRGEGGFWKGRAQALR
jgi:hopene-associated glycosyltransferase HpnB